MCRFQVAIKSLILMACILFVYPNSFLLAQSENIVSLQEISPDKACGPRCLWALMQITKAGEPDCGIKCIYELINKGPFSVTNLKELKDAAEQLGFSAEGYKLKINRLAKIEDYAILPIGKTTGTPEDPFHFILVKRVIDDYVIVVNTKTLALQAVPVDDLQEYWNGYALVITAGRGMEPLSKSPDDLEQLPKRIKTPKYDQIKDFGQVDSGSVVEHTFTIFTEKNENYTAKIVQKNCACLEAKLGKDIEDRHTLTMKLHVNQPAWQQSHAVVLLEPGGIIKRFAMRAYGTDAFEIWPPIAYIEAPGCGLIEYPVTIEYFTGSDDVVKYDRIYSSISNLECGQVKAESSTEDGSTVFKFEIPLLFNAGKPLSEIKSIRGNVDFVLDTGKGQRHIPMQLIAQIGREIYRLTPDKVFLMPSKSSQELMQKSIKVEFLTKAFPQRISVNSDVNLPLEIKATQADKSSFLIDVSVINEKLKNLSAGMNKGELVIVPEGESELNPIKLPVSLFVRE